MALFFVILIWIVVIGVAGYVCFVMWDKASAPAPFKLIGQIVIGLAAIILIASLFFPIGIHLPLH